MIYSVNFKSKHKLAAGEIRCPHNQLGRIIEFIKENPTKRYCVEAPQTSDKFEKTMEQVELLKAIAPNYTLMCGSLDMMLSLLEHGYNAFLRFPVSDWETYNQLKNVGVSDIYIDGPLGFQMNHIMQSKDNIKIRVSPTVSPNASISDRSPTSFFIRPEDIDTYSFAVDVVDFKEPDQEKEDALFQIYNRGSFGFTLDQLINGMTTKAHNSIIASDFVDRRLNCGQVCQIPGRSCHLCSNQVRFAEMTMEYFDKKSN